MTTTKPLAMRWARRSIKASPSPEGQNASPGANSSRTWAGDIRTQSTVLVVTCRFDPHADAVIDALDSLGVPALRLNSEDLLTEHSFVWRSEVGERISVASARDSQASVSLGAATLTGYYRTPSQVASPATITCAAGGVFARSEGEAFFDCLYALEGIRWFPPPYLIRPAEAKIPQLQLAKRLGLRIPRTIVTNDPAEARAFIRELRFDVAVKPLKTSHVAVGEASYEIYTRRLSPHDLEEHIEAVRWAPTMLQEYIPKLSEFRVIVIGANIFAVEIDSQSVPGAEIDWQEVDPFTVPHRPTTLPDNLVTRLRRFLDSYGLVFGAIDLLRNPEGDFIFLENNPNGQWYWLEVLTGLPMAASMARLLTGRCTEG